MLTLLHLSDLHITTADAGTQFDLDLKVREELLKDLGKDGRTHFDAILVTGDIAYHGRSDEFARAKAWLEEVRTATVSAPEALFVVPGNHDVNQATVSKDSSLWELHQSLRKSSMSPQERLDSLSKKLHDPFDFLAALTEYRAFAAEYGCPTNPKKLTWVQVLDGGKALEDGTLVRIHGLNSAILSDGADTKANLLLSDFQFENFNSDARYVNIVMCHHPHSWLIDGNESNDHFRQRSHIVLSGHEHDTRCYMEGKSLRVQAGAIHPNRRETRWEPCYHVIRLSVDATNRRELCIRVETRVWREKDKVFGKFVQGDGSDYHSERLPLPDMPPPPTIPATSTVAPTASSTPTGTVMKATSLTPDEFAAARRKLIVHFFRIGTLSRYTAAISAGVWEESDDALDGQERWARVFDRAEKAEKLGSLWDAVAGVDPTLAGQSNPFTTKP